MAALDDEVLPTSEEIQAAPTTAEKMSKVVSEIVSHLVHSYETGEEVNLTRSVQAQLCRDSLFKTQGNRLSEAWACLSAKAR